MSIKLSRDVKNVVRRIIADSMENHFEVINSLMLLEALMENEEFSELVRRNSTCEVQSIRIDIRDAYGEDKYKEQEIFEKEEIDFMNECLREVGSTNGSAFHFSEEVAGIFFYANIIAEEEGREEISFTTFALSFFENLTDVMKEFFRRTSVNVEKMIKVYSNEENTSRDVQISIPSSLKSCITNLNERFEKEECTILGRDREVNEVWKTIMKKTKRNVILKGEPGVGKSSIVYKITSDIVKGTCPAMFRNYVVLSLDINNMIAGAKYRGDAEKRFEELIEMLKKYHNIILFIDEIHMMVGAGNCSNDGESQDLSNALKPILAGDEAIVIGATTNEEYERAFGNEGALRRRFRNISVGEPKAEEVYPMLKKSIKELETFHDVRISKRMVEKIIFYSACFNYTTRNPDRTKDLIDLSMVAAEQRGKKRVDVESIMGNFTANFERFRNMPIEMVKETAYHEIGHYIVRRFSGKLENYKTLAISIIPAETYLGVNVLEKTDSWESADRSCLIDTIAVSLAGRIAEEIFMNAEENAGASDDLEKATKIAYNMVTKFGMSSEVGKNRIFVNDSDYQLLDGEKSKAINDEVQKIIDEASERAKDILQENRQIVEVLVDAICKEGMLNRPELEAIIQKNQRKEFATT